MSKKSPRDKKIDTLLEKLQFIKGTIMYDPLTDDELVTVERSLNNLYAVITIIDTKYFNPSDGTSACHPREDDE